MEFNKINNPEFNDELTYSLDMMSNFNRTSLYTPQINNISLHIPSSPILYNWDSTPKVIILNLFHLFESLKANITKSLFV